MASKRAFDIVTIGGATLLCLVMAILNNFLVIANLARDPGSLTLTDYGTAVFGGLIMGSGNHFIKLLPYLASTIVPPVILGIYLNMQMGGYLYFTLIRVGDIVKWWRNLFIYSVCLILLYAFIQMAVNAMVFFLSGNTLQIGNERPELIFLSFVTFVLYMTVICSMQLHIQAACSQNPAIVYIFIVALPIICLGLGGFSSEASIWFPGSYGMSYRNDLIRQFISKSKELELEPGWNSAFVFLLESVLIVSMYCLTVLKLKKSDRSFAL